MVAAMATRRGKKKRTTKEAVRRFAGGKREIKLTMVLPPDLPTLYADNVNVVHTPSEFTLSFLQARPPLFGDQAELDNVDAVEARCIARIVVSPLRMQLILQTLAANFKKYVELNLGGAIVNANDSNTAETDTNPTSV